MWCVTLQIYIHTDIYTYRGFTYTYIFRGGGGYEGGGVFGACCGVVVSRLYMLKCVAVWCSVLQCVAVCCSVWQCVAVCGSEWQYGAVCCSVLQCVAVCGSVWQCVAVWWCLLYMYMCDICAAVFGCVVQCSAACCSA